MTHPKQYVRGSATREEVPRPVANYADLVDPRRALCAVACLLSIAATLAAPPAAQAGWPLESPSSVVLGFGATYTGADGTPATHRGVDLAAREGSAVRAPLAGRVSFVGRVPGTGGGTVLAVTVACESGSVTLLPLSSATVRPGAELAEGDSIGVLAGTGDASWPDAHLHTGVRRGDVYLDPLSLFAAPVTTPAEPPVVTEPEPITSAQPAQVAPQPSTGLSGARSASGAAGSAGTAGALAGQGAGAEAGPVIGGTPTAVAVPGAQLAPGISVAGPLEESARVGAAATAAETLSAALWRARNGATSGASADASIVARVIEWAFAAAGRAVRTGSRLLAGVLLALGALWPIWRREGWKGEVQVRVRPVRDDVAAVRGR